MLSSRSVVRALTGRGPVNPRRALATSLKIERSVSGMTSSRASRLSASPRAVGPNPLTPRSSSFLTRKRTDRSKNSLATPITRAAICVGSCGRRSSSSRCPSIASSRDSSSAVAAAWTGRGGRGAAGRGARAAGAAATGGAAAGMAGALGRRLGGRPRQAREDVGHDLRRERLEVRLELLRIELREAGLEHEALDSQLLRAGLDGRGQALDHEQHRGLDVGLGQLPHRLEPAVERRAARGRHPQVDDEQELGARPGQRAALLHRAVGILRLLHRVARPGEVLGQHLAHVRPRRRRAGSSCGHRRRGDGRRGRLASTGSVRVGSPGRAAAGATEAACGAAMAAA